MSEAKPPVALDSRGQALWDEVTGRYELRPDEYQALGAACAEADLIGRIEEELSGASLTTTGSMGQIVTHPLLTELRQHRVTMAQLLRGLKLPDESGGALNAQREGGLSRWAKAHGQALGA